MIKGDSSFFKSIKFITGQKGHPESIKFRFTMDMIISYAIDMDVHIKSSCNDLRERIEPKRQEYESYLQFSPEDELDLERERLKFKEDGDADLKCVKLVCDKRAQIEDDLDDEERAQLEELKDEIDDLEYDLNNLVEDYLQLLFESLFIAAYSRFERYLIDLCNNVRKSESLPVKRRELRGQGILASFDYLEKIAKLKFPDTTEEWDVIQLLNKIRNSLVHNPEQIKGSLDVDPKLLGYLYLHDEFWEEFEIESTDFMFSLYSIQEIVATFVRFSQHIDEAWEKHDNLKQKFKQGPKHNK